MGRYQRDYQHQQKSKEQIRNINNNEKLIIEKKQIANMFYHFFCNIPKQIEKGIIRTQKTYEFLTNPLEKSFKFDLTSDEEIITYFQTLKNNGSISISNKLFKKFKKPLSTPLNLLINLTFTKVKFPNSLKIKRFFLFTKKIVKLMLIIIGQYHSYPISVKLLKKLFMILKITISFIYTNLDLEQIIQQIMP